MLELPGPRREALRKLGAVLVQVNPSQLESDWMVDLAVQLKITCLVHISSGSVVASAAVSRWWFRGSIHHDKELVAETALHDYVPIKVSASCARPSHDMTCVYRAGHVGQPQARPDNLHRDGGDLPVLRWAPGGGDGGACVQPWVHMCGMPNQPVCGAERAAAYWFRVFSRIEPLVTGTQDTFREQPVSSCLGFLT